LNGISFAAGTGASLNEKRRHMLSFSANSWRARPAGYGGLAASYSPPLQRQAILLRNEIRAIAAGGAIEGFESRNIAA
jgi:hypothetical protein